MLRPVHKRGSQASPQLLREHGTAVAIAAAVAAVILFLPFPLGGAAIIAPAAAWILLLHPVLLPLGLIASVPVQDVIPVPEGVPITLTRIMTTVTVVLLPLAMLKRGRPARWSLFLLGFLLIIFAMALSLGNAVDPAAGFAEIYHWVVAGLAFWLILQFVESRKSVLLLLGATAILSIVQGATGGVQALLGVGPDSFQIATGFSRAHGSFGMPNSFAAYMEAVTLPLLPVSIWAIAQFRMRLSTYTAVRPLGYEASSEQRRALIQFTILAFVLLAGVVAGLAAIALSFSRGGWLGTLAALAVMVVLLGRRAVITSTISALVLTIGLMFGASGDVLEVVEDRFTQLVQQAQIGDIRGIPVTDDNFATVERMSHWQTAIAMWDRHPFLGVGAGNFDERFSEFAVHPQFNESQGHAHNYYLHLLAETGLVGLSAYLVLLIGTFVIGWRAWRSRDSLTSAIGIGAIGLSVALTVHNLFENLHVLNITIQMAAIWAVALVAIGWSKTDEGSTASENSHEGMKYDTASSVYRRPAPRSIRSSGEHS